MQQPIGIVFPGQGSQSVGMLSDIAQQFNEVEQTFAEASDVLGYDLWALAHEGPAEVLDQTVHTQPALLAASVALYRIMQAHSSLPIPLMLAGHSLGEYTALVCAEALAFQDAVKLVAARGRYMQEAVLPGVGAMAAIIGLDDATVLAICQQASNAQEMISPANYNSLGQVVIAGHQPAVLRAIQLAKEQGAKMAVLIPVSVPSHCELMRPAAVKLAELLATIDIAMPMLPVLSNVDVLPYANPDAIRDGLVRQLFMPVRWVETIQHFVSAGVSCVVECGPGKILTGLNKRIDKNLQLTTIEAYLCTT